MKIKGRYKSEGLTLIEVIVVLLIVAVAGTSVFTFLGKSFVESHVPVQNLIKSVDLDQVMANIRADYKPYPVWQDDHEYSSGDKVMPTAFSLSGQRYWYKCTVAGTSGSTEPSPWTTGTIPLDNTVQWTYQASPPLLTLNELKSKIGTEDTVNKKYEYDKSAHQYGYYVVYNRWIDFDSSRMEINSNNQNILKVTIKNDIGETVSALFY